jgi:hypothetical protein
VSCSEDVGFAADCGLGYTGDQVKKDPDGDGLPSAGEKVTTLPLYLQILVDAHRGQAMISLEYLFS